MEGARTLFAFESEGRRVQQKAILEVLWLRSEH